MPASRPPSTAPQALSSGRALACCHVAVLLFGLAGLFGKWLPWDAVGIVFGRTLVAAAVLALVVRWRHGRFHRPSLALASNGVVLALHWVAFFAAIQVSTVAIGLLGFASFPLFVPWLEGILLGVELTRGKLAAAALVAAGLVLVVPDLSWTGGGAMGLGLGVLSGLTFALLAVRSRQLVARHPATHVALWQNAVAAVVVLPFAFAQGGPGGPVDVYTLGMVLVLGVLCTAVAHTLFTASLVRLQATTASICAALEPVYGAVLALVALGEVPGWRVWTGMAILVGAAIVASRRTGPQRRRGIIRPVERPSTKADS